jgi:hypothetical protein
MISTLLKGRVLADRAALRNAGPRGGVSGARACTRRRILHIDLFAFFDWRLVAQSPVAGGPPNAHSAFVTRHATLLTGVFWIRPCACVHRGMPGVMTSPQPVIKKSNANNEELALAA